MWPLLDREWETGKVPSPPPPPHGGLPSPVRSEGGGAPPPPLVRGLRGEGRKILFGFYFPYVVFFIWFEIPLVCVSRAAWHVVCMSRSVVWCEVRSFVRSFGGGEGVEFFSVPDIVVCGVVQKFSWNIRMAFCHTWWQGVVRDGMWILSSFPAENDATMI